MFNFLKLKSKNKIGGHKIRTKGIIIGFCWVIIASTVISAVLPSYQAFADMSNIVYRTQAYFYSQALKGCLSSAANYVDSYTEGTMGQGDKQTVIEISDSNASKGVWFNADIKTYPSYLGNDNGVKTCNGVLKSLASLWGYEKYSGSSDSLMCELMDKSGIEYRSSTTKGSCENGNEDFNFGSLIPGTTNSNLTKLVEGVDKLNKSKGFSWEADSGAANWYTMYLADLKTGCNLVETTDTNVTNLYTVKLVDTSTGTVTNTYFEGSPLGTKIKAYTNNDQKVITQTCQEVLDNVNKRSDSAAKYFGNNPMSTDDYASAQNMSVDEEDSTDEPTCGSSVTGVGWIVCPLINAITGLNDTLWAIVSSLLNINPLSQSDSIYSAWQIIRNIANIVFVIFFMIIIFSQLTSIGISNYGVKKLLPRLIVCAILVNVSFLLIQIVVDLSNIIGVSLYDLLNSLVKDSSTSTWSHLIGLALSGITVAGVALLAGGPAAAFWILFPAAIAGLIGLLAAFLTLVVRQAIIPILAILAPLAIVAYLLPNTESLFKKWKNLFIPMLMMYPLAAIIFGGCKVAASIIISGNSDDFFQVLVGLIVMTLPLFSLPFLVKSSGTILSTVGNKLGKVAEKINSPIKNFSKSKEDLARAKYLGGQKTYNPVRNTAKFLKNRRMTRELNTKAYNDRVQDNWNTQAEKNPNSAAGRAYLRSKAYSPSTAGLDSNWDALKTGKVPANSNLNLALSKIGYSQQKLTESANKQQAYAQSSAISKNIQAENYAKTIQDKSKGTDLQNIAVGVDKTYGPARVQSAAQSTINEARTKNINAAKILFASQGYSGAVTSKPEEDGNLIKVVTNRKLADGSDATPEQIEAAIGLLGETGNPNAYARMSDTLAALPTTTEEEQQTKTRLQQALKSVSDIRGPKAITGSVKGNLSSGQQTKTFQQLEISLINKGKLSSHDWASIKNDETSLMTKAIEDPSVITTDKLGDNATIDENTTEISKDALKHMIADMDTAFSDDRIYNNIPIEQREEMKKLRKAVYKKLEEPEPPLPTPRHF